MEEAKGQFLKIHISAIFDVGKTNLVSKFSASRADYESLIRICQIYIWSVLNFSIFDTLIHLKPKFFFSNDLICGIKSRLKNNKNKTYPN